MQALAHLGALQPHVPADVPQLWAGRVGNLLLTDNGRMDPVLQVFVGTEDKKQPVQAAAGGVCVIIVFDQPRAAQQPCDLQQLPGAEAAAPLGPAEAELHILQILEAGGAFERHEVRCGTGLRQALTHLRRLRLRLQRQAPRFGRLTDRAVCQPLQDGVQLQRVQ